MVAHTLPKRCQKGEVWGSIPMDSISFEPITNSTVPRGSPWLGHVAPDNLPKPCHLSQCDSSKLCQFRNDTSTYAHSDLPCHLFHVSVRSCHVSIRTDCTNCTVSVPFFTCLAIRTDRDISLVRHPFEPKQVALGLWQWGLHTCSFWGNFENFYFWAKFWPLVEIFDHSASNVLSVKKQISK